MVRGRESQHQDIQEQKSGTQRTQSAAEDTEKSAGRGRHGRKPETTENGLGVRSKSTSCIPGAPEPRFLGRAPGAPGITSGQAGSRLRRARAVRATAPSAPSVEFGGFRDQLAVAMMLYTPASARFLMARIMPGKTNRWKGSTEYQ